MWVTVTVHFTHSRSRTLFYLLFTHVATKWSCININADGTDCLAIIHLSAAAVLSFKSEEQAEIVVWTPAQSLCVPTGMRRSMLGLLVTFSVCAWGKRPFSDKASDLYHRSAAGPGMFNCSSLSSLFISLPVSFSSHFSLNQSFSLLLFVCLSLHPIVTSGRLFHPSLSPSSPPSLTEPLCNVDHQARLCQPRHSSH